MLMQRTINKLVNWFKTWIAASMVLVASVHGQSAATADDPVVTLFPHSQTTPYWISGQDNIIFQWHPAFDAAYSGRNSFRSQAEHATSNVATIFLGYQLSRNTEVFADAESAAGGGLSDAFGLAGFLNVDVVRNPELGPRPYLARAMIRQIISLSSETKETERGPFARALRPGHQPPGAPSGTARRQVWDGRLL